MQEIHLVKIDYIEKSTEELPFKYKPDVPKLKLYGEIINFESEDDQDNEKAVLFLTQKQLNQIIGGKGIEIVTDEDRWYIKHPLNKEQIKQVGLVDIKAELVATSNNIKHFEVLEVS